MASPTASTDLREQDQPHSTAPTAGEEGGGAEASRYPGGRPQLPDEERRTHRIGVNVNQAERDIIEAKAEAAGMSPAAFLRQAGLGAKLSVKASDRVYHQMSRIGVNVNQMAREANATGRLPELKTLEAILSKVLEIRKHV